jgi:hypothetical protein
VEKAKINLLSLSYFFILITIRIAKKIIKIDENIKIIFEPRLKLRKYGVKNPTFCVGKFQKPVLTPVP